MRFKLNMRRKLMAVILLANTLRFQGCTQGCLSCESDGKCRICDTSTFYALKDGACHQINNLNNCLIIDNSGKCLECDKEFYIDPETSKCVAVDDTSKIQNCAAYNSNKSCIACNPGFYVSNSICLASDISVSNCEVMLDNLKCRICNPGFILKPGGTGCIKPPAEKNNCVNYSFVRCRQCSVNYKLDYNRYLREFKTSINDNTNIGTTISTIVNEKFQNVNQGFRSVCQPIELTNCAEIINFKKCRRCNSGFYLSEDWKCIQNPQPTLPNCITYSSANACSKCEVGYRLSSLATCIEVTPVKRCIDYDTSAFKTVCLKCEEEYYLTSNSTCTSRSRKYIDNCLFYAVDKDECETCQDGYKVTSDGAKCLEDIAHCESYNISTNSSSEHTCNRCQDKYFMASDKECKEGTVSDCKEYEPNLDQCVQCKEGFYLESGRSCLAHNELAHCEVYHPDKKNKCLKCENLYLLFTISNLCVSANEIPGCIQYSSESTCQKCDQGYILSETSCVSLPDNMNCLVAESLEECSLCKPNYILFEGECKIPPSYILNECGSNNLGDGEKTLETAACLTCNNSTVPWDFKNEFICVANDWVVDLRSDEISECNQLEIDGASTSCKNCNSKYFLKDNSCVETCDDDPIITNSISVHGEFYRISGSKFCNSNAFSSKIDNCRVYAYANNVGDGNINADPICVHCDDNFGKVIDPTSNDSTGLEDHALLNGFTWRFTSPVAFLPKVNKCVDISNTSNITMSLAEAGSKHIDGCEYYKRIGETTTYACIKCKNGKHGILANTSDGDFIESCVTTNCNSEFIPGLQAQLNSYVSCYKCVDQNSIPYLFIKGGTTYTDINGYKSYDLEAANDNWDSVTDGGFNVNCHARNGADFTGITPFNLPSNCAIAAFNVESESTSAEDANKTNLDSTENLTVFCLACEPGYKRNFGSLSAGNDIPYMVYQCSLIENCSGYLWFNYCSECSQNNAFLYDESSGIDYTQCVSFSKDPNCLTTTAAVVGDCVFCKKGFTLNYDGHCEALTVPNCQTNQFNSDPVFKRVDFGTVFYHFSTSGGCQKCDNNFTPVKVKFNTEICVPSVYLALVDSLEDTRYIKNCTNYYLENGELKCRRCRTGFVLAANLIQCLSNVQLRNCVLAISNVKCQQCISGFVSINYECERTNIANCIEFDTNPAQSQETCLKCVSGYYIRDNKCVEGNIKACARYRNNGEGCFECIEGYTLVKIRNRDYCHELPTDMDCENFDTDLLNQNTLKCTQCKISEPLYLALPPDNEPNSVCLPIVRMNGCEKYANTGNFIDSTLLCEKCSSRFYLKNGNCILRDNRDDNCEQFAINADKCLVCNTNYYLGDGNCYQNPMGIMNCRVYLSETICFACIENHYLFNNKCISIPNSERISNCLYYKTATICSECRKGFALLNGSCVQARAKNCLTIKNIDECETCSPDRGLKTENGVTSCVSNPDSNCLRFKQIYPFICTVCRSRHYPNSDGVCVRASQTINNCEIYDSDSTCIKCNRGLALNPERTQCSNSSEYRAFIGSTCENSIIEVDPICTQCPAGHIFDESGECVKACSNGCHYCDPDEPENCFLCTSGFYMDSKKNCVIISGVDHNNSQLLLFFNSAMIISLAFYFFN